MTKKQFNWLKDHQPFEVIYVKLYDGTYIGGNIKKAAFIGERIYVNGVKHQYNKETKKFKEIAVKESAHYKNIRKITYNKGEYYKQYYNTEGNARNSNLEKLS